MMVNPDVDGYT